MGAAIARQQTTSLNRAINNFSVDFIQDCSANLAQVQVVSIKGVNNSIISGIDLSQYLNFNQNCVQESIVTQKTQADFLNNLKLSNEAVAQGILQTAISEQITNSINEIYNNWKTNITQNCSNQLVQSQTIEITETNGSVIKGIKIRAVADTLKNCNQNNQALQDSVIKLANEISATNSARAEFFISYGAIVLMIIVIIILLIIGLTLGPKLLSSSGSNGKMAKSLLKKTPQGRVAMIAANKLNK